MVRNVEALSDNIYILSEIGTRRIKYEEIKGHFAGLTGDEKV